MLGTPGSITKCYLSSRPRPEARGRGQRVLRPKGPEAETEAEPEVTRPRPRPNQRLQGQGRGRTRGYKAKAEAEPEVTRPRPRPNQRLQGQGRCQNFGLEASLALTFLFKTSRVFTCGIMIRVGSPATMEWRRSSNCCPRTTTTPSVWPIYSRTVTLTAARWGWRGPATSTTPVESVNAME